MLDLQSHTREIGKTLAPVYGPESPSDAVDRLLEYYYELSEADKYAFVAALIGELVTLKTAAKHRRIADRIQETGELIQAGNVVHRERILQLESELAALRGCCQDGPPRVNSNTDEYRRPAVGNGGRSWRNRWMN